MNPVYNDYISDKIKNALISDSADKESLIHDIQGPYMDVDEDEGYLLSLKRTIKVMDERFDIELADSSRTYHFYDEQGHGCDKWLEVISQINASRRSYLRLNMGEYDADVLEAMARRKKKRKETACYIL